MKKKLLAFIEFLDRKMGFKFDVNTFENRFRLQKYVFISKFLGADFKYGHSMYLRGPYSSALAEDYYNLETLRKDDKDYLDYFEKEKFIEIVKGKDNEWLEIATTLLSVYKSYKRLFEGKSLEKKVVEATNEIKSFADKKTIEVMWKELKAYGLIEN